MAHKERKDFAKEILITMAGVGVGAAVSKMVTDGIAKAGIAQPYLYTVKVSDMALVGAELVGAYKTRTRKPRASKFLIGMASAVVATNVATAYGATSWLRASMSYRNFTPMTTGKYVRR